MKKDLTLKNQVYSNNKKKNKNLGKGDTVRHLNKEGETRSTIYFIINRFETGLNIFHKKESGRTPKIMAKSNLI